MLYARFFYFPVSRKLPEKPWRYLKKIANFAMLVLECVYMCDLHEGEL